MIITIIISDCVIFYRYFILNSKILNHLWYTRIIWHKTFVAFIYYFWLSFVWFHGRTFTSISSISLSWFYFLRFYYLVDRWGAWKLTFSEILLFPTWMHEPIRTLLRKRENILIDITFWYNKKDETKDNYMYTIKKIMKINFMIIS